MFSQILYETLGCQAIGGCQNQALAAVEDVELAAMANQVAGPWCTDDVCTASLKDFADSMAGIFEMKQKPPRGTPSAAKEMQRELAEDYITGVLGAPSTMVSLLSVKDMWNTAAKQSHREKKRLLNRAKDKDAQAIRLQNLRNRMTFEGALMSRNMPFVQVITSFDDIERGAAGPADEDLLCYDSDPGDVRERKLRRGPRRSIAERDNICHSPQGLASNGQAHRYSNNRRWKKLDEDAISDIIEVSIMLCLYGENRGSVTNR